MLFNSFLILANASFEMAPDHAETSFVSLPLKPISIYITQ